MSGVGFSTGPCYGDGLVLTIESCGGRRDDGVDAVATDNATLTDSLRVVRRRKWLLLQAVVIVPLAAVLFSLVHERQYETSAAVLLNRQGLASSLAGSSDPSLSQQPERLAQTQADLARVPEVAAMTLRAAGVEDRTPEEFLQSSAVTTRDNSDLLEFTVTDSNRELAARLATEYARQFTRYRTRLELGSLARARGEVEERIADLRAEGRTKTPLFERLLETEQQLRTVEALQPGDALVVRPAGEATQVAPRPFRDGLIGLALGLCLGLGLVFLWEALDTRVRSAEELAETLHLTLLGRLPKQPRRRRGEGQLVTLRQPAGAQAEAFRILRTNLEVANLERRARTIMLSSAVEQEGKSTTVANLGVLLARAGRRVTLIDLDFRHPSLGRLFGLGDRPGLTETVLGDLELDDALIAVAVREHPSGTLFVRPVASRDDEAEVQGSRVQGVINLLTAGPSPPDLDRFLASRAFTQVLDALRERSDFVLIDSPPMLRGGDAFALSAEVDGLVVVMRLKSARQPVLDELARLLWRSPAAKLGLVVVGSKATDPYQPRSPKTELVPMELTSAERRESG